MSAAGSRLPAGIAGGPIMRLTTMLIIFGQGSAIMSAGSTAVHHRSEGECRDHQSSEHTSCGGVRRLLTGCKGVTSSSRRAARTGPDHPLHYLFATVTIAILSTATCVTMQWIGPISMPARRMWCLPPIALSYFHLAQAGIGPWIGAEPVTLRPLVSDAAGTLEDWVLWDPLFLSHTVFGVFSTLVIQGLCIMFMCRLGPRRELAHVLLPPLTIYTLAWSFYVYNNFSSPLLIESDVFGVSFAPMHMVLWMCSTSVQATLWAQIHEILCVGGVHAPFELPCRSILHAMLMLWGGILGSLDYACTAVALHAPAWLPNAFFLTLSTLCFYQLLASSLHPLRLCVAYYHRLRQQLVADVPLASALQDTSTSNGASGDAANQRSTINFAERQLLYFRAAIWYVLVTWHVFPLVYALGAFGVVGGEVRESLYSLGDLLAKFLPVSMYLSLISV